MSSDDLARILKELDVVSKEPTRSTSGLELEYYISIKKACGYHNALDMMAEELWRIMDKQTTCVAATGYGGKPLAAALVTKYHGLKACYIREKMSDHGERKLLEGHIPTVGDKVTIIDDVFSTGSTIQRVARWLEPTGAEIVGCAVVVNRYESKIPNLGFPVKHILTSKDLI